MINKILILLSFAISLSSIGQTEKYVEVSVSESVSLKAQSAVLKITKSENYSEYEYLDDYYSEESYYEDEEYYRLLEESPKKVTKQMQKEQEDRQKQREILEKAREAQRLEDEKLRKNVLRTFAEKLTSNGTAYTLKLEQNTINYYNEDQDSQVEEVIYVTVTTEAEYAKLLELSAGLSLNIENFDVIYEKMDDKLTMLIESISQKAKIEGEILAKSLNKKLGSVLSVSNLLPANSMTFSNLEQYSDLVGSLDIYGTKSKLSPFSNTRKSTLVYVYRFALLD